jgi:hypothetical protein
VNGSSLSPEEIRAAAETHSELGRDYQSAVIDSFIEKVGREIDARVDARVAGQYAPRRPPAERTGRGAFPLAIVSMVMGIPLTAIVLGQSHGSGEGLIGLIVVWLALTVINVAYYMHSRSLPGRPDRR